MKLKQFAITLVVSVTIFSVSCKKNEEPNKQGLADTWHLSNISISGCDAGSNGEFDIPCTATDCTTVVIGSDGSWKITTLEDGQTYTESGTYIVIGSSIEICLNGGIDCNNYELTFEPGSFYFAIQDTDGATGCIGVSTFIRQ